MVYLKLQDTDGTVVGIEEINNPTYVCYQERNSILIRCSEKEAQGIMSANENTIYQIHGKEKLQGIEEQLLDAFFIDDFEYEVLKNTIDEISDSVSETSVTDDTEVDEIKILTSAEMVQKINTLEKALEAERQRNDMLEECILEMSEAVYA